MSVQPQQLQLAYKFYELCSTAINMVNTNSLLSAVMAMINKNYNDDDNKKYNTENFKHSLSSLMKKVLLLI